jgi:transcriptional regulator with XRE-family HTH domain
MDPDSVRQVTDCQAPGGHVFSDLHPVVDGPGCSCVHIGSESIAGTSNLSTLFFADPRIPPSASGYASRMPRKPRPKTTRLRALRIAAGLQPRDVRKKLHARGYAASSSAFTKWDQGANRPPVPVQRLLSEFYGVPFLVIQNAVEGLPDRSVQPQAKSSSRTTPDVLPSPPQSPSEDRVREVPSVDARLRRMELLLDELARTVAEHGGELKAITALLGHQLAGPRNDGVSSGPRRKRGGPPG